MNDCVMYSALKKADQSAKCEEQLEKLLEGKDEEFKKSLMDSLHKQLKELH